MSFFSRKKKENQQTEDVEITNDPQMLFARLLFEHEPTFNDELIAKELAECFEKFDTKIQDAARQFFFPEFMVEYKEGSMPAQCTIFKPETYQYIKDNIGKALRQSWHWQDAEQQIGNCKHELVVNDLMSLPLSYKLRVTMFQRFLAAIVSVLRPKAIFFPSSEKVVEVNEYLKHIEEQGVHSLYGLLNVRLFNIQNNEGHLMDSIGMQAFGLPDFQIRFTKYDPGHVAGLLYSYSEYIFGYGSVIKNGNTVEGVEEGSK